MSEDYSDEGFDSYDDESFDESDEEMKAIINATKKVIVEEVTIFCKTMHGMFVPEK